MNILSRTLVLSFFLPLLTLITSCIDDHGEKEAQQVATPEDNRDLALLESNQFRGYKVINQEIGRRLFNDDKFALAYYIEDTTALGPFAEFVGSIKDLLGVQKGSGLHSGFQNGTPNSMNMTVWYMALSGLATDAKTICQTDAIGPFTASDAFVDAAKPLCQWPIHYSQRRKVLEKFWKVIMEYDSTPEEFDAWFFFAGSELRELSGEEALFNLVFAAYYNPQFLIAK